MHSSRMRTARLLTGGGGVLLTYRAVCLLIETLITYRVCLTIARCDSVVSACPMSLSKTRTPPFCGQNEYHTPVKTLRSYNFVINCFTIFSILQCSLFVVFSVYKWQNRVNNIAGPIQFVELTQTRDLLLTSYLLVLEIYIFGLS